MEIAQEKGGIAISLFSTVTFTITVILSIMASDSKKQGKSLTDQRILNALTLIIGVIALVLTLFVIANAETGLASDERVKELLRMIIPWVKVGFIVLLSIGAVINIIKIGKEG